MTRQGTSRIVWSFMAGAALLAACVVPASAQGPSRRGGWSDGPLLGVPLRTLNLTADQQTQVQSIFSASRTANRPIIQQLRQAQTALSDALLASPAADVSSQLTLINGLRSQLLLNSTQTTAQVLAVLTPDQRAKAAQLKAQLSQLRTQMHQLLMPSGQ